MAKPKFKYVPLFFLCAITSAIFCSESTAALLTISEAEKISMENSHRILAQQHIISSTHEKASAERVKQFPMLGLGGQAQFMSKVGEVAIPVVGVNQQIGDHKAWSVGPVVDWVAWDAGQIGKRAKSIRTQADAERETLEAEQRQVLLTVRAAYIGVLLAQDQVRLVQSSLSVARDQYNYVSAKKAVGASDKFDATIAHQEVADRELDLEQAKGELLVRKRALFAALAMDATSEDANALEVESTDSVLNKLLPSSTKEANVAEHPEVKSLGLKQKSAEIAASSAMAAHWPKLTVTGSAVYQYPNFGVLNTVQQNTLTLGLRLPILDWGMINKESRVSSYQAMANLEQKKNRLIELQKDLAEARDNISTLKSMKKTNVVAVKDAKEVASLAFDQYKTGRIIFLDVQKANNRSLTAQVQAARTDAELAVQIARLISLAETENVN